MLHSMLTRVCLRCLRGRILAAVLRYRMCGTPAHLCIARVAARYSAHGFSNNGMVLDGDVGYGETTAVSAILDVSGGLFRTKTVCSVSCAAVQRFF